MLRCYTILYFFLCNFCGEIYIYIYIALFVSFLVSFLLTFGTSQLCLCRWSVLGA
jgi:hypothetical protein